MAMTEERKEEVIRILQKEVKPALGCTEPIAVALAVAKAVELLRVNCCEACTRYDGQQWRFDTNFKIAVEVSANILKNGMGVGIPGTGMVGLPIAAALGAVCGQSSLGLEVLNELSPKAVERAKELVSAGFVSIQLADNDKKLYVKARVEATSHDNFCPDLDKHKVRTRNCHIADAEIADDHDHIIKTSVDDIILSSSEDDVKDKSSSDISGYHLSMSEIYEFATTMPLEDIWFLLESRTLNLALSDEGLAGNYGLMVGKTIHDKNNKCMFGSDFMSYAMAMTAAASDARMAGCTLPAMSNSGSGNQGITVTIPVIAFAKRFSIPDEQLVRALCLSHLTAIHIKTYLGKLSALCGCVIASTGASCGIVYLNGGSFTQICSCIKNMIGNITGMLCDGAKLGCALKVASGVSCAVQSAVLALKGIEISENDGIIEKDIEKTIRNLGTIGSVGMQNADNMILDIMSCK